MDDDCRGHILPCKSMWLGREKDLLGSVSVCNIPAAFCGIVWQMRRYIFLKDLIIVAMGQNVRMENKMEIFWPSRRCSRRDMYQNLVLI